MQVEPAGGRRALPHNGMQPWNNQWVFMSSRLAGCLSLFLHP